VKENERVLIAPDKTHCSRGHVLTEETELRVAHNTRYGKYTARVCRVCSQEYGRERRARIAGRKQKRETEKGEKPSGKELAALIGKHTWTELGIRFGVSDVAVRNWAKGYGLLGGIKIGRRS
jgi:hypothetical protein